ncbi:MAG TPA: DUF4159 domain-containing protein [Thermoanaerobaculia bacterium]|jgi:hypothetical protein|nr:DUF4159 domain-containing protein [Thermoanaerobaculia bacterium]
MRAPLAYGLIAFAALVTAPRGAGFVSGAPAVLGAPLAHPQDDSAIAARAAADDARIDNREWASILQRQLRAYSSGPIEPNREFYFTRAFYSSGRNDLYRGFPSWSVDWPKADIQFMMGLKRLVTHLDAYDGDNPVSLADPDLLQYPFLYAVEVGYMSLTEPEVTGLRNYLDHGGFLVVDDFWGSREWANFEHEIRRVLPGHPIVEIPLDHPIFHSFYDIKEIVQVPNVGQGRFGGPTWEQDGITPTVRGIFDDDGRLMVAISWNSDLGDAWEWAEDPFYPLRFSTYAYQLGVNLIVYAMSH